MRLRTVFLLVTLVGVCCAFVRASIEANPPMLAYDEIDWSKPYPDLYPPRDERPVLHRGSFWGLIAGYVLLLWLTAIASRPSPD